MEFPKLDERQNPLHCMASSVPDLAGNSNAVPSVLFHVAKPVHPVWDRARSGDFRTRGTDHSALPYTQKCKFVTNGTIPLRDRKQFADNSLRTLRVHIHPRASAGL